MRERGRGARSGRGAGGGLGPPVIKPLRHPPSHSVLRLPGPNHRDRPIVGKHENTVHAVGAAQLRERLSRGLRDRRRNVERCVDRNLDANTAAERL